MITGDFLFEPRKGQNYDKDDDHLAQMMELLGRMPKNMALSGKNSTQFFDKSGSLKNIRGLNYWPLQKVLMEKYRIKEKHAVELSEFLRPMLTWYPHKRATAQEMLKHPWLDTSKDDFEATYHYTEREYEVLLLKKQMKGVKDTIEEGKQEMSELQQSDEEENGGDDDSRYSSEASDDSLVMPMERKQELKAAKEKQAKVNNSYTGPYPQDPIDFPHADKGANTQFTNALMPKH
jgi:serine/threonine protein kinase